MEERLHKRRLHRLLVRAAPPRAPAQLTDRTRRPLRPLRPLRYFFATVLSVYNKWMFSREHFGFPFPLFVTMMHMYIQFMLAAVLRMFWPRKFRPEHSPTRADYA